MNIENIKKVNKDIVKDGRVQSFKEQLFDVFTGGYDLNNMMVVSDNSKTLNYVDGIDENKIITISPNKVLKVMTEHKLSLQELGEIENLLKNSVIAFDSLTHESSRVVVLDKQDIDGNILIAIFKTDTTVNVLDVNKITSIYGKKNFENFINRTYEAGKNIYVNDKTKEFVDTQGLQLPNCITNSLYSNDIGVINISQALNNNQIEELLIEGAKKAIINHLNDRGENKKFLYEKFNEDNPDIKHIQMGE